MISSVWVAFMVGMGIGGVLGVIVLALCVVAKDDDFPQMGPPRLPR